ncbi:hypothetical protein [Chlorobium sp. N1]|uniref:hypothetical protein n=1 Tax=Chlorobium sp. N1 TaxID=2491138 RepID=UPI001039D4AF|nr:hypothetical protein [Chlorobium sp. N1]TCD48556.1 hypothetical protein E0L29_01365 [Chlorobium sp. N1]
MKQSIIFMTGCIDPGGMHMTVLNDTEKRKAQYLEAIGFYLKNSGIPVLFVENSGNDISGAFPREIRENKLEIITFQGNDYDKKRGKGYGEMLIIEEALHSSRLFRQAEFIFKVTGRYKVLNIASYIAALNQGQKTPDMMINLEPGLALADSRFFGAVPRFFEELLISYRPQIDEQTFMFFEKALANAVHEAIILGLNYIPLPHYPRHSAESGTGGGVYNDSWSRWLLKEALLQWQYRIQNAFRLYGS